MHAAEKATVARIGADLGRLMTGAEVAVMFGVGPKAVTQWGRLGLITAIRTPGGHRRYAERQVLALRVAQTRRIGSGEPDARPLPGRVITAPSPAALEMRALSVRVVYLTGGECRAALQQITRHASPQVLGALTLALDAVAPDVTVAPATRGAA